MAAVGAAGSAPGVPVVPERGATPLVSARRRRALALIRPFTSPLAPDDYLELINPLWSTRELRGRVEHVRRETPDTVTVTIKPGWEWPGHRAGQYVRLGLEVDGIHHWRAYSLTSDPSRADGRITITPKLVPGGKVSPFLCTRLRPGTIVRLGGVEGTFTLPDPPASRLLLISAGSGITPIASMVRALLGASADQGAGARPADRGQSLAPAGGGPLDIVHIHSTRDPAAFAFGPELRALAARRDGGGRHPRGAGTGAGPMADGTRAVRHRDGGSDVVGGARLAGGARGSDVGGSRAGAGACGSWPGGRRSGVGGGHPSGSGPGGYRLYEWVSSARGRLTPSDLDSLCPDWRTRDTFLCGPAALLQALEQHWHADGDPALLHVEHFQPDGALSGAGAGGAGGAIAFRASDASVHSDGTQPILAAGEAAGVDLPSGCRMGICHSCVGRLCAGQVRDLRTGRVHGQPGELIRTCINAPEGDIELEL